MKILLVHIKEFELWFIGDMKPIKDFRQERDKGRDTGESSLWWWREVQNRVWKPWKQGDQ